jgi:hypothetical protein
MGKGRKNTKGEARAPQQEQDLELSLVLPKRLPIIPSTGDSGVARPFDSQIICSFVTNMRYHIYAVSDFLRKEECDAWIDAALPFIRCDQAGDKEYAERRQDRLSIDRPDVAQAIFERLKPVLQVTKTDVIDGLAACACSSNIRLYRYNIGDSFGKHIDESNIDEVGRTTKLTVLIYLTGTGEGLQGGETKFYSNHYASQECAVMTPLKGHLLFHAHGPQCLTHCASPVLTGQKYVLRTDVLFK